MKSGRGNPRVRDGWLAILALSISVAWLYGQTISQTVERLSGSAEWFLSFWTTLALSILLLAANINALRIVGYSAKPSDQGYFLLALAMVILFVSPSLGVLTLAWLSLIVFVLGYLVSLMGWFGLRVIWPMPPALVLALGPGLNGAIGGITALSYVGVCLILSILIYRSRRIRRLFGKASMREPCELSHDETEAHFCPICGRPLPTKSGVPSVRLTLSAMPFFIAAGSFFTLDTLAARFPGLALESGWKASSNFLLRAILSDTTIISSSVIGIAILLAVFNARRTDVSFASMVDRMAGSTELVAFDSFRRSRSLTGIATGVDALRAWATRYPGISSDEFVKTTMRLQKIGVLTPTYILRRGSFLRAWRVKVP